MVSGTNEILKGAVAPFNVGMGQVQSGHLYLRYGSKFVITTAKSEIGVRLVGSEMCIRDSI